MFRTLVVCLMLLAWAAFADAEQVLVTAPFPADVTSAGGARCVISNVGTKPADATVALLDMYGNVLQQIATTVDPGRTFSTYIYFASQRPAVCRCIVKSRRTFRCSFAYFSDSSIPSVVIPSD